MTEQTLDRDITRMVDEWQSKIDTVSKFLSDQTLSLVGDLVGNYVDATNAVIASTIESLDRLLAEVPLDEFVPKWVATRTMCQVIVDIRDDGKPWIS